MHKAKLLSAALIVAATFATPVLAANARHVTDKTDVASTVRSEGDACVRAPRVGAFATEPWTNAAPCEPNTMSNTLY
jgi:hypothetical protein